MAERGRHTAAADDWGVSWEGHRRAQLTRALAATPAQRLAWLEEMLALAYRTGALPRKPLDAVAAGSSAAREARRRGTDTAAPHRAIQRRPVAGKSKVKG